MAKIIMRTKQPRELEQHFEDHFPDIRKTITMPTDA